MPARPVTQEPGFVLLHGRVGPENYRSFDRLFRATAGRPGKIGDDMARQEGCGSLLAGQSTLRIFRRVGQQGIGIFVAEKVVRKPAAFASYESGDNSPALSTARGSAGVVRGVAGFELPTPVAEAGQVNQPHL